MTRTRELTNRRRIAVLMTGASVIAVLGGAAMTTRAEAALPPECIQPAGSTWVVCTYAEPSVISTFTVPDGVNSVHVLAIGGKGGSAPTGDGLGTVPGGYGARVEGDLPVTPGETLYPVVGGNGLDALASPIGGFASDIRTDPVDLSTRLVVAAGGGAAGGSLHLGQLNSDGGAGGNAGAVPQPGQPGQDISTAAGTATAGAPGQPGGSSAGGAGGAGGVAPNQTGCGGADGTLGRGGVGGAGPFPCELNGFGGGGAGVYGGGQGGSGADALADPADSSSAVIAMAGAGGGGAGSSLAPAGGTITTDTTASPEIVISYALADLSTSITGPRQASPGSKVTYVITVANAGPSPAPGTALSSSIPAHAEFRSITTTAGQCIAPSEDATSGPIRCALGNLAASASVTIRVRLTVGGARGSAVRVSASASSTLADPNPTNNAATATTTIVKKS